MLTFRLLRRANLMRMPLFRDSHGRFAHTQSDGSDWSPAQWLQALVGKIGEFANIRKKYERGELTFEQYRTAAASELADIATYLDILAARCLDTRRNDTGTYNHPTGIDLSQAVVDKWNEVSARVGCDLRIVDTGRPTPQQTLQVLTVEPCTRCGTADSPYIDGRRVPCDDADCPTLDQAPDRKPRQHVTVCPIHDECGASCIGRRRGAYDGYEEKFDEK